MKIAVVGAGYVGLSNAVLLAQNNEVTALDIVQEKVDMINNKESPIIDLEIEKYLQFGFTEELKKKHKNLKVFFSPEFLREGRALHDNLYPSRIIVGEKSERAKE